jgi:DNA-binding NarL/FixJ family response regulator
MSDRRVRVLVAEDQAIVRDGLAALVSYQDDLEVVGCAADGEEAVRLYRELWPDVTLMDLRMPQRSGLEAIEAIRAADPEARVLVLTTYDGDEDVYRALQAGARGYLLKDATTDEFMSAIRTVACGERHIPAAVARRLADRAIWPVRP